MGEPFPSDVPDTGLTTKRGGSARVKLLACIRVLSFCALANESFFQSECPELVTDAMCDLLSLGAVDLRDRLASGTLRATELAEACLARIAQRDGEIRAWAWCDPENVRDQARRLDAHRAAGQPLGMLHGLPIGLKDVIDTAGIPTENGCAADIGRVPEHDSYVVERLKQAGAILLGKTATTELAYLHPSKTRNPRAIGHSPGGSSSGSAAAVADGMTPLAIGTQTGGSVIRPASYCGVTGFKPTFGAIPRRGVLLQSQTLDTVGVFAADPSGAAMLADALFGFDAKEGASRSFPPPGLLEAARSGAPRPPVFAFLRPPGWERATNELWDAFEKLRGVLENPAFELDLPDVFDEAAEIRARINLAEMAYCYQRYAENGSYLGEETRTALEQGRTILARDYLAALEWPKALYATLEDVFARCDAILCPAATGPAPEGLSSTGDSIFNGIWTLFGTPAITVPILRSESGLPLGVQLVGRRQDDGRLLRTAQWLYDWAPKMDIA